MKKIISLILLLTLAMTLASCDMLTGGGTDNGGAAYGLITSGDKSYFVTPDGTVEISGGVAKTAASAPEGTPASKKFDAPTTMNATFETKAFGTGVSITKVSGASVVMIPKTIDGKAVLGIEAGALKGVKAVIFATPDAAITIVDGAFEGVSNVYIATAADNLLVGKSLLTNASGVNVYVSADELSNYKVHYNWSAHAASLKKF